MFVLVSLEGYRKAAMLSFARQDSRSMSHRITPRLRPGLEIQLAVALK